MKKIIFLIIIFLVNELNSQSLEQSFVSVRKNVVFVMSPYEGRLQNAVIEYASPDVLRAPSFLNKINIENSYVKMPDPQQGIIPEQMVKYNLQKNKIANQMIHSLYFTKNGEFTYDNIIDLATYNMSDSDAKIFDGTSIGKTGSATRKYYEAVLKNNWIIFYNIYDIRTMEEEYDRTDAANRARERREAANPNIKPENKYKFRPVARVEKGYMANLDIALVKIDLDGDKFYQFENTVFKNGIENQEEIKKQIMNYPFDLKKISILYTTIKNTKLKSLSQNTPIEQFLPGLFKKITKKIQDELQRKEDFKILSSIYDVKPNIQVKIGTKEGVKTNDRFVVYEQRINKKGKVYKKKIGAIRLKGKPSVNSYVAKGEYKPSEFYQYFGKKLDKGMLVKQFPSDYIIQLSIMNFFDFRFGKFTDFLTQIKWIAGMGVIKDTYSPSPYSRSNKINNINFFAGLYKEFIPVTNISFELGIGAFYDITSYVSEKDSDNELSTSSAGLFIEPSLGFYISPSVKIGSLYKLHLKLHQEDNYFYGYSVPSALRFYIQFQ